MLPDIIVLLFYRENLPGHFKFKEYCPRVFHNLRKQFGLDDVEFMVSNLAIFNT